MSFGLMKILRWGHNSRVRDSRSLITDCIMRFDGMVWIGDLEQHQVMKSLGVSSMMIEFIGEQSIRDDATGRADLHSQRFKLADELDKYRNIVKTYIGVVQGHSHRVLEQLMDDQLRRDLVVTPDSPEWRSVLVHGTSEEKVRSIMMTGLELGYFHDARG